METKLSGTVKAKLIDLINKHNPQTYTDLIDYIDQPDLAGKDVEVFVKNHLKYMLPHSLHTQRHNRYKYLMKHACHNHKVCKILNKHLTNNGIPSYKFKCTIRQWLNMIHPKKATLHLVGAIDAGKSMIAQAIVEPFIVYRGTMSGCDGEHYFDDLCNKSIAILEEIFVLPKTADDYKTIFSGYPLAINRKHEKARARIFPTPCIVTGNYEQFGRGYLPQMDELALSSRCYNFAMYVPFHSNTYIPYNEIRGWLTCNMNPVSLSYFQMATPAISLAMKRPPGRKYPEEYLTKATKVVGGMRVASLVVNMKLGPKYVTTHIPKLDSNGQFIYVGQKQNIKSCIKISAADDYQKDIYAEIWEHSAENYATPKALYDELGLLEKKYLDPVKKFMKEHNAMIWFHPKSQMVENCFTEGCPRDHGHYHILVEVPDGPEKPSQVNFVRGLRQSLNKLPRVFDSCKNCVVQSINNFGAYLKYLNDGHCLFMGSKNSKFLSLLKMTEQYEIKGPEDLFQEEDDELDLEVPTPANEFDEFDTPKVIIKMGGDLVDHMFGDGTRQEGLDSEYATVNLAGGSLFQDPRLNKKLRQTKASAKTEIKAKKLYLLLQKMPDIVNYNQLVLASFHKKLNEEDCLFVDGEMLGVTGPKLFGTVYGILQEEIRMKEQDGNIVPQENVLIQESSLYDTYDLWSYLSEQNGKNPLEVAFQMYLILQKKLQKKNTILFQGDTNACKTLFGCQLVEDGFKNVCVQSYSANMEFFWATPYQLNASVIVLNEYVANVQYLNREKNILEGRPTYVNVKYSSEVLLPRTPIVITANNYPWTEQMTEVDIKAIKERMFIVDNMQTVDKIKIAEILKGQEVDKRFWSVMCEFFDQYISNEEIESYEINDYIWQDSTVADIVEEANIHDFLLSF